MLMYFINYSNWHQFIYCECNPLCLLHDLYNICKFMRLRAIIILDIVQSDLT